MRIVCAMIAEIPISMFASGSRLAASGSFPFGKGKRLRQHAGGLANALIGGWSTNVIASFMTGNFFSVTVAGDRANVGGFPFQRANRTCDGNLLAISAQSTATSTPAAFNPLRSAPSEIPGEISWRSLG